MLDRTIRPFMACDIQRETRKAKITVLVLSTITALGILLGVIAAIVGPPFLRLPMFIRAPLGVLAFLSIPCGIGVLLALFQWLVDVVTLRRVSATESAIYSTFLDRAETVLTRDMHIAPDSIRYCWCCLHDSYVALVARIKDEILIISVAPETNDDDWPKQIPCTRIDDLGVVVISSVRDRFDILGVAKKSDPPSSWERFEFAATTVALGFPVAFGKIGLDKLSKIEAGEPICAFLKFSSEESSFATTLTVGTTREKTSVARFMDIFGDRVVTTRP